jgi:hypothetical protein
MGYLESKYNYINSKIAYENLELAQEYRTFKYSFLGNYYIKFNLIS